MSNARIFLDKIAENNLNKALHPSKLPYYNNAPKPRQGEIDEKSIFWKNFFYFIFFFDFPCKNTLPYFNKRANFSSLFAPAGVPDKTTSFY